METPKKTKALSTTERKTENEGKFSADPQQICHPGARTAGIKGKRHCPAATATRREKVSHRLACYQRAKKDQSDGKKDGKQGGRFQEAQRGYRGGHPETAPPLAGFTQSRNLRTVNRNGKPGNSEDEENPSLPKGPSENAEETEEPLQHFAKNASSR